MRRIRSFLLLALGFGVIASVLGVGRAAVLASTTPHIMEIMEENVAYSSSDGSPSIIGSSNAPFLNSLAGSHASATQWFSNEHASANDYNIAIAGSDFGDKKLGIPATDLTLVNELDSNGVSWKGYMESMPAACDTSSNIGSGGLYDEAHDPFVHFKAITSAPNNECATHVVGFITQSSVVTDLDLSSPAFVWVTPNVCDDMHQKCGSNRVAAGDKWLKTFIPAVMGTQWYASGGVIIITWDESSKDAQACCADPGGGHIATLVISSTASGQFTSTGDHDGTLRAIEEAYGLSGSELLGGSSSITHGDLTGAGV